ncbi:hypothetical protein HK405_001846, partial [Cladochytrium tenue]
ALAAKSEHAAIRVWSTATWKEVSAPLASHSQTVTALRFSPDDAWLLSGGRDRLWSLFRRSADDDGRFQLTASNGTAHARIIWDCAWSADSRIFATASRDKTVKLWSLESAVSGGSASTTLMFEAGVTAVAFHPSTSGKLFLAVGLEDGQISVHTGNLDGTQFNPVVVFEKR